MTVRPARADLNAWTDITRSDPSPSQASGQHASRPPDPVPGPSMSVAPERMRSLSTRLADGYYDRPEVVQHVIERILNDL
ncbi:MAG: hypothetical protein ABIU54_09640 [Candidatus Eisenbacteria bacterium]